ncbi:MAG: helix-turn-helix domain-containing protein [Candidatus Gastranaerophilales bacterium]
MRLSELPDCPIETTWKLVGDKWKTMILRDLLSGAKRFVELKKNLAIITPKSLTSSLRKLEQDGLVLRKVYSINPPKVEYSLTDVGYSLAPVLSAMASWGTDYKTFIALLEKQRSK